MAYWFIRLGSNDTPEDENLHRILAEKYRLITIGYGIKEDITDSDDFYKIKKRLKTNGRVAGLVHSFVNGIGIGDTIISPIGNGQLKIGKVMSECKAVKSFYDKKNGLKKFIERYTVDGKNHEKVKPAIKVNWIGEVSKDEFPPILQNELLKFMPAAVNKLKISDFTAPVILAMVKYAENKKDEAAKLLKKANGEHFASEVNSAAKRTGLYSAIFAAIISVSVSRIISIEFTNVTAWLWFHILIAIITIVIFCSTMCKGEEWDALCRKYGPTVKKLFSNFRVYAAVFIIHIILLIKPFWSKLEHIFQSIFQSFYGDLCWGLDAVASVGGF